jgi:Flagellar hook-basal body protein
MNISSVGNIANYGNYITNTATADTDRNTSFDSLFQAAMSQVKDTNSYANAAKEAETAYSLGLTNNTADLLVAQQKANISLQYTVALRNGVLDAYKEIMNLQF